jgi:hypothetical protein
MGKKRGPKQSRQPSPSPSHGSGCGSSGNAVNPAEVSAAHGDVPAGVPIGLPVFPEKYEEMQRRALRPDPNQARGHEDSSA